MAPPYPTDDDDDFVGLGTTSSVPPKAAVGQDYLRRRKKAPLPANPFLRPGAAAGAEVATMSPEERRTAGFLGTAYRAGEAATGEVGRQVGQVASNVATAARGAAAATGTFLFGERPAPAGAEKAPERAGREAEARTAAATLAPPAQPDPKPVTRPTSTGTGGPTRLAEGDRMVQLPGDAGYAIIHARGADPATQPGGFAHAGARRADPSGWGAERERIAALPERGSMEYGPKSVTGGHQWTRWTPGRQEAAYDAARYRQQTRARQATEEAAISEREAAAARAGALADQPFAPEMAEVAGRVGEARARTQAETRGQNLATQAYMTYRAKVSDMEKDPNLSPEDRRALRQQYENEFWMAAIAGQPSMRRPRQELMFGAGMGLEDEA